MIYLQLFLSFLQIGAFSFGGGYAAMPLIQNQVVQLHPWLTQSEFTDLITISQMTPGPIAVNSATFVGTRIAGMPGALVATFGCVLPSCILVTAFWGGAVSGTDIKTLAANTNLRAAGIFLVSLALLIKCKMNPIHVMLLSGAAEVAIQLMMKML